MSELLVDDDRRGRTVTLNRPDRLNAMTVDSYRQLAESLTGAADEPAVSVVLLQGAGRGFCSGADLGALRAVDPPDIEAAFQEVVEALIAFPKPLVAAVHGVAVGFGMTMLLHCDLVVVADDARLRVPFAKLGTAPEAGSSWLLPHHVGPQRAADLLLTGRFLSGVEATEYGLAARCCAPQELGPTVRAIAHNLTTLPLPALLAAKRLLREGWADRIRSSMRRELTAARALEQALGALGLSGGDLSDHDFGSTAADLGEELPRLDSNQ